MADVTPELMFEVLKSVQTRLAQVDGKIDELKQEMQASRTSQNGIRQDHRRLSGDFGSSRDACPARGPSGPYRTAPRIMLLR